jgi:DNA-binding MarR family transcriptional regulator
LKKTPVAVFAEGRGAAHAVPANLPDLPDPPSPGRSSISGPMMVEGGPMDYDDLIRKEVKEKLAVMRVRLSLTPEQEAKIAKALPYGQAKTKIIDDDTKVIRASSEDKKKMEDAIRAALTAEQQKDYDTFRAEEKANAAEAVANRELSRLQSMTTLSPEQKDQAFAAFSGIASRESMEDLPEPGGKSDVMKDALETRWAARLEALGAILTPEQMAIYQQAGNPFDRTGG